MAANEDRNYAFRPLVGMECMPDEGTAGSRVVSVQDWAVEVEYGGERQWYGLEHVWVRLSEAAEAGYLARTRKIEVCVDMWVEIRHEFYNTVRGPVVGLVPGGVVVRIDDCPTFKDELVAVPLEHVSILADQPEETPPTIDGSFAHNLHHPAAPGDPVRGSVGMRARVFNENGEAILGIIDTATPDYAVVKSNQDELAVSDWSRVELVAVGPPKEAA